MLTCCLCSWPATPPAPATQHDKTLEPLRLGAVNIHPSLLPKVPTYLPAVRRHHKNPNFSTSLPIVHWWSFDGRELIVRCLLVCCVRGQYRGPCPLEHTLMNGDTHTGVALIRIDPKRIDVGAVVSLTEAKVDPADTYDTWVPRDRVASHALAMLVVHPAADGSSSPVACLSSRKCLGLPAPCWVLQSHAATDPPADRCACLHLRIPLVPRLHQVVHSVGRTGGP